MGKKMKFRSKIGIDFIIILINILLPFLYSSNATRLVNITEMITSKTGNPITSLIIYMCVELVMSLLLCLDPIFIIKALKHIKISLKNDYLNHSISNEYTSTAFFPELTQEIDNYVDNYYAMRYDFIVSLLSFVVPIIFMLFISYDIAILMIIFSIVDIFVIKASDKKVQNKSNSFIKETESLNEVEDELLKGHDTILSYSAQSYANRRFKLSNSTFEAARFKLQYLKLIISQAALLPSTIAELIIILCIIILHSKDGKAPTVLMSYFLYSGFISNAISNIVNIVTGMNSVKPLKEKFEFLNILPSAPKFNASNISFKEISLPTSKFTYTFEEGKRYVITGKSGIGKSTILRMMVKEQSYNEGSISMDGKDYNQVNRKSLLSNIAYVPQDPIIFEGSMYDNLLLGKDVKDEGKLLSLLNITGLDTLCGSTITDIKNYHIEESGKNLSGGEKQKIAFIRAILEEKPFLLLDESVRAIDKENSKKILDYISHLNSGYIMVSHFVDDIPGEYTEVKIG